MHVDGPSEEGAVDQVHQDETQDDPAHQTQC